MKNDDVTLMIIKLYIDKHNNADYYIVRKTIIQVEIRHNLIEKKSWIERMIKSMKWLKTRPNTIDTITTINIQINFLTELITKLG